MRKLKYTEQLYSILAIYLHQEGRFSVTAQAAGVGADNLEPWFSKWVLLSWDSVGNKMKCTIKKILCIIELL